MYDGQKIDEKILKTLIYFDLFDYPLTAWEIWKWLFNESGQATTKVELPEILSALDDSQYLKNKVGFKKNFYFLAGRGHLVETRLNKYVVAWQKFRKVRRVVKILKIIPFIKMIAVANDLAYFNAPRDSDLDFFIITAKKRLWLTRFFAVLITKILGLRPTEKSKKDKVCLSIFISEEKLNMEYLKISRDDIHFTYWLENLIPIYDADDYYQKLRGANGWLFKFLPQAIAYEPNPRQGVFEGKRLKSLKKIAEFFFLDIDEKFYRWLEIRKFPDKIKKTMNQDTRVVVNDYILKFHTNDNRREILNKFQKQCQNLL